MILRSYVAIPVESPWSDIRDSRVRSPGERTWFDSVVPCMSLLDWYFSLIGERLGIGSELMDKGNSELVSGLHATSTMTNPIIRSNNLCIINHMIGVFEIVLY